MLFRAPEAVVLTASGLVVGAGVVAGQVPAAVLPLLLATTLGVALRGARWWPVLIADVVAFAFADPHATRIGDVTFTGGLFAVAYLVGRAVWAARHRVGALELQARQASTQQQRLMAAAVQAERTAMAVELHDIVMHAVSAVVVQAQAGRRCSTTGAGAALASIEQTAREAMSELRRLLTLLGAAPGEAAERKRRLPWRDVALSLGVLALGQVELWSGERYNGHSVWSGPRWFSTLVVIALAGALLVRRGRPEQMAVAVCGLLVLDGLLVGSTEAATGPVVVAVAAFSAVAYGARWRVLVPLLVLQCAVFALTDGAAHGLVDRVWLYGLAALAVAVGAVARRRQRSIRVLEQGAALSAAEHEQRVRQALSAERAALALELHDIVSHAVSVMVIQAQAGQRSPASAADALGAIEAAARTAMAELRRLLVLLEPDEHHAEVRPTPSLLQLDELLLHWRAAGLEVDLARDDLPPLPPAVDLAAYRIVQESLTNSARHAPGARVRVALTVHGDQLEVRTRDTGDCTGSVGNGAGRGLIGMRQRVELVGGVLLTADHVGDGFVVHARLPLTGVPA